MGRLLIILALAALGMLPGIAVAADVPDFELEDLSGDEYALEDLLEESNLLVIDFWEVGCKPCDELLTHLQEYYDDYQDDGVEFVIISRDTALTQAYVEPFFVSHEYTFRVLLDGDQEVSKDYGVKASPATFIINPDAGLIYQHYGYKAGQEKEILEVIELHLASDEIEVVEELGSEEEE